MLYYVCNVCKTIKDIVSFARGSKQDLFQRGARYSLGSLEGLAKAENFLIFLYILYIFYLITSVI